MPVTQKWAYFDHAAVSPLPSPTADAIQRWCREAADEGDTVWPDWAQKLEQTRVAAAELIGADTSEIALIPNTTAGITLVAEGLDWQPGDNLVTLADEFPSNAYPWLHLASRGVETRRVPTDDGRLDVDALFATCDARTRLITLSWVGYSTGYRQRIDQIAELAHERGILVFVDAIQGLGVLPLDVRETPIDFLAADGHKWMLGPEGAGFAYIRHEHLDRLRALGVGWNSVVHAYDYTRIELKLKPTAARYEGGSPNMVGMLGFGASLKLLLDVGVEGIAAAVLEISDHAVSELRKRGAQVVSHRAGESGGHDPRSGIVTFELPGKDPMAVRKHCLAHHVALACRNGRLRISPHAYNNEEDVERLIAALKKL